MKKKAKTRVNERSLTFSSITGWDTQTATQLRLYGRTRKTYDLDQSLDHWFDGKLSSSTLSADWCDTRYLSSLLLMNRTIGWNTCPQSETMIEISKFNTIWTSLTMISNLRNVINDLSQRLRRWSRCDRRSGSDSAQRATNTSDDHSTGLFEPSMTVSMCKDSHCGSRYENIRISVFYLDFELQNSCHNDTTLHWI